MMDLKRLIPLGLLNQKPRHFQEMLGVLRENRDNLGYAWRILNHGVCDGCSLGPRGLKDDVIPGPHLCTTRLKLLRLNTMPAMPASAWGDIEKLRRMGNRELHMLGRVPYPLVRHRGEKGFRQVSWDEALDLVGNRLKATDPARMGFWVTSRGVSNETYYIARKVVAMLGTNNLDLCSRLCHAASVAGLGHTVGVAAPTCSLSDFIGTDLLVLIGTNLANNQPVATKYLRVAKQKGTRIVVVNTLREKGLDRYWIPSVASSALFGTDLADEFFPVTNGGDIGFLHGTLKHLIETGGLDEKFIASHTADFPRLKEKIEAQSWEQLEAASGLPRAEIARFGEMYAKAKTAVFVWSMGITQHHFGSQNVMAIVNLALARGMIGRPKTGLMPIRGHSGVQGGGELGVDPEKFAAGFPINEENAKRFGAIWHSDRVSGKPGMRTHKMVLAMDLGQLDVLYNLGGNLLKTMPDPAHVVRAADKLKLRVHQDIVLNESTLLDSETTVVLPAMTKYEQPGGATTTSTERRLRYSPTLPRPDDIGEPRAEWRIMLDVAKRVLGADHPGLQTDTGEKIRAEIAVAVPLYAGIENLKKEGDHFQWGGEYLLKNGVCPNMPDGKARFEPIDLPDRTIPPGKFRLGTRRGKQFNSIVFSDKFKLDGARTRDEIMIHPEDACALKIAEGGPIRLKNELGSFVGRARFWDIHRRSLMMYWPEANVLIDPKYDPISGAPDYNTLVEVEAG